MPIRVLVIDDSLFMRTLVSDLLNSDPEIKVIDTAKDGKEAIDKIIKLNPDCVTLDLAMPGWDGLTTLKHIMESRPVPVIVLSAYSKQGADITVECLEAGAVGFVLKPSGELSLNIETVKLQLLKEVKAASKVNIEKIKLLTVPKPKKPIHKLAGADKIVIIGASTGGFQALESILPSLPSNFPLPVIVAQHVPNLFFTESLAQHLNRDCRLPVKIAEDDRVIQSGTIYLAPGGSHTTLRLLPDTNAAFCIKQAQAETLTPSVDLAMKSAVEIFKENTVGIILSGMGRDGCEGMKAIKNCGGRTIVQDESSLIFGMPKAVIDAGAADKVLPAGEISEAIIEAVCQESLNV